MEGMHAIAQIHDGTFRLTPNQNLTSAQVAAAKRTEIQRLLDEYRLTPLDSGSALRHDAMACVARPPCGLAMGKTNATCHLS